MAYSVGYARVRCADCSRSWSFHGRRWRMLQARPLGSRCRTLHAFCTSNCSRSIHISIRPPISRLLGWNIQDSHDRTRDGSQVDLPRLVQGGLDGGFWAIYTPQGPRTPAGDRAARDAAIARAVSIREMVAANPKSFELALKADDAAAIAARHKRVVFLSLENSYPLEADLSLLETFYKLGVRLAGLAHFTNNDLADSSTDPHGPEWHGLSDKGRALVGEANRLGIVLDGSHARIRCSIS